MNELERIRAVLLFMRTHIPIHLDGMPLIDTPEQARDYLDANRLYWLESLLAVATAARAYMQNGHTGYRFRSATSGAGQTVCIRCQSSCDAALSPEHIVHQPGCSQAALERAVAALEEDNHD